MNVSAIISKILFDIQKSSNDTITIRSNIKIAEVLEALITLDSIKTAALVFDKSESAFENIVRRNILPLFPTKQRNVSWDNYLLGICNLKKCTKCSLFKPLDTFYNDAKGKASWCKECTDIRTELARPKFIIKNRLRSKKHYINNKHYYIFKSSERRRLLYQAMPPWANLAKIKEIYKSCPKGFHVDHIIPLQGALVCGLHVETNLISIPAKDNLIKGNKFTVD